jgi:hypothetical protein
MAYCDKEGLTTENQKYVDELSIGPPKGEKTIIDLSHSTNESDESKFYSFEGDPEVIKSHEAQMRTLGTAIMLAKNPS